MIPAVLESPWSGSTRVQLGSVCVAVMPDCEAHPTDEQAAGVLSISWESFGTGFGHVYCCVDCAGDFSGRFAAALDDSPEDSIVKVELQQLAAVGQVAA